jgi:hypothetical protein
MNIERKIENAENSLPARPDPRDLETAKRLRIQWALPPLPAGETDSLQRVLSEARQRAVEDLEGCDRTREEAVYWAEQHELENPTPPHVRTPYDVDRELKEIMR